jgi:hypothetical protein
MLRGGSGMREPPRIDEFRAARAPEVISRRAATRCRADRLLPGECFKRGFYGGLGVWVAFLVVHVVMLAVFLLAVMLLGGMGALAAFFNR